MFHQGDIVKVKVQQYARGYNFLDSPAIEKVHKGVYLYSWRDYDGNVIHRVDTWTGAGCVDTLLEDIEAV